MKPIESMAAIVSSEKRTWKTVRHHIVMIFGSESPMMKPEMTAAKRMPLPVADSQLKPNTAGSGAGLATAGGTRSTSLLTPAIGNCGLVILLGGVFQLAVDVNTFSGVFMIFLPV